MWQSWQVLSDQYLTSPIFRTMLYLVRWNLENTSSNLIFRHLLQRRFPPYRVSITEFSGSVFQIAHEARRVLGRNTGIILSTLQLSSDVYTATRSCIEGESQAKFGVKRYLIFVRRKLGLAPETRTGRDVPPRKDKLWIGSRHAGQAHPNSRLLDCYGTTNLTAKGADLPLIRTRH